MKLWVFPSVTLSLGSSISSFAFYLPPCYNSVSVFMYSPNFTSLSALPPVSFWAKSAAIHHLNYPTFINFQPHYVFAALGQTVLPTYDNSSPFMCDKTGHSCPLKAWIMLTWESNLSLPDHFKDFPSSPFPAVSFPAALCSGSTASYLIHEGLVWLAIQNHFYITIISSREGVGKGRANKNLMMLLHFEYAL